MGSSTSPAAPETPREVLGALEAVVAGGSSTIPMELARATLDVVTAAVARDRIPQLGEPVTQAEFGDIVGISQQAVSDLLARGVLRPGETAQAWLRDYRRHLEFQASRRDPGGDLAIERARLARSQRIGQDIRNRRALAEYAPVPLLEAILRMVSDEGLRWLDRIAADAKGATPDLPAPAQRAIDAACASARAEWIRATASLDDRRQIDDDDQADAEGGVTDDDDPAPY